MAVTVAVGLAIFFLTVDPPAAEARSRKGGYRELFSIRKLWPIFPIIFAGYAVAAGVRSLWVGPYLEDIHAMDSLEIGRVTLFLAIGIIVGSALVPRLIPLEHLRRARFAAYLMSLFIIVLSFTDTVWSARTALFVIGTAGGMFIVPVNAALQEIGYKTIGSGGAVAMQNFFQNVAMLLAVGSYTLMASINVSPVTSMLVLGLLVFSAPIVV